jgi:outer membrane protein OmpA-like peptidoglycan-associated protein/uncharacterized protein YhjY with autotransporter beta-barrel domain
VKSEDTAMDNCSGLWVQLRGGVESFFKDENSLEDYRDVSMGVMFGFDRFLSEKDLMWGVYGRINKDNVEQGKHRADGNKNGLGLYGGYLKDSWGLKAMLLGSYDRFATERMTYGGERAKADINALTLSADLEAALNIDITENILLKPYAGIEAANVIYDGFKEKGAGIYNLDTKDGSYLRSAARIGAGLDYERGRWIWYANVEGKYIFDGTKPEVKSEFEETGIDFYSRGAEEGKIQIGAGIGAEVRIAQHWKIFANAKYYAAERYENLYGNIGVRYMFGKKKSEAKSYAKEADINADEAERLAQEALEISLEALEKAEESKEKEKEIKKIETSADKEQIYILKIKAATEAIEKADKAIERADEAIKKGEEVQGKVDLARESKAKAAEEGYGARKSEKEDLRNVEVSIEKALDKAETAKQNALKAKREANMLLIRLEEERIRNEELERRREEEKIRKEISDDDMEKQKAEAQERRKRKMLKTYTLTANFKPNSYFLTDEFKDQLKEIVVDLKDYDYKKITIEGHTDSTGSKELNKKLSRQRARSVHDELVKTGIPSEKISYAGFADTMPIKSNNTKEGRAVNRRTEIFIE